MNKMKINLISLFVLILCSSFVYATSSSASTISATSEWARINVTIVNQDPDPVEPGGYVTVRFKFENRGSANAEDVTAELMPEYPFSLDEGESAVQKIGSIHGRQIGDIGVIVKYRLRVDKDAVEGDNELELRYKTEDNSWIKLEPFKIDVQTYDAILSVDSVLSGKEMIKPGEASNLIVKFENIADSLVKEVRVRLDLGDVPFAPIGSTNEKTIKKLDAGEEAELNFKIMAEADAESKVYKIPLFFDYQDELGNRYYKNSTIGLVVGDLPDLSVIIDSSEVYSSGKKGSVVIKFVNKGVTDIKFLNVKLRHTNDYKIISSDEVYIGNIDSDNYETAEFTIFAGKTKAKEIVLPISIEYKDANNNDYAEDISLELKLYSAAEAKKLGLAKGSSAVGIFIMILIVVGGFFGYRKWRKRRKIKR